jgi:hypothetical protein
MMDERDQDEDWDDDGTPAGAWESAVVDDIASSIERGLDVRQEDICNALRYLSEVGECLIRANTIKLITNYAADLLDPSKPKKRGRKNWARTMISPWSHDRIARVFMESDIKALIATGKSEVEAIRTVLEDGAHHSPEVLKPFIDRGIRAEYATHIADGKSAIEARTEVSRAIVEGRTVAGKEVLDDDAIRWIVEPRPSRCTKNGNSAPTL